MQSSEWFVYGQLFYDVISCVECFGIL